MDIIISKEEIKEYEKLKVILQLTLVKERIKLFESKYGCSLDIFREGIEKKEGSEDGCTELYRKAFQGRGTERNS